MRYASSLLVFALTVAPAASAAGAATTPPFTPPAGLVIDEAALDALPNLYFHLVAAYIALRGAGVPLGKADFDGLHAYPPAPGRTVDGTIDGTVQGNQA
jgi:hypothetical protein